MGKDYPLPVTIKGKDRNTYNIIPHLDEVGDSGQSFWRMFFARILEIREEDGDEAFGSLADNAHQNLHLELAGQLFPQLVSRSGRLRYSKADQSELLVAKKNHKRYLTTIKDNATFLLKSSHSDLAKQEGPLTSSTSTQDLLTIAPRSVQTSTEHLHRTQLESHESTLEQAAEIIRQELVTVGAIASNYADSARKAYVVLEAISNHLLGQLQPQKIDLKRKQGQAREQC